MGTIISHSPEETRRLGEAWGRRAQAGWVVGLSGELGTGKTQWVKGFARGLGFAGVVRSPTFALVQEYVGGRVPLAHLDFYRLESPEAILRAGLQEYLDRPRGITVVEWIERWLEAAPGPEALRPRPPAGIRRIHLVQLDETVRQIVYENFGD